MSKQHQVFLRGALLAAATMAAAACGGLQSPATDPAPLVPRLWRHAGAADAAMPAAAAPLSAWWQTFGDARLDALIEDALATNNDLRIAALRLERARLRSQLVGTNLTPDVDAEGKASRQWNLDGPGRRDQSGITVNVGYEVDLWGRLASLRSAAEWEARATAADHEAATITLIADTARLYWRAGLFNDQIALSDDSLADARRTLELVEARYRAGAVSALDLAQARQQLAGLLAERTSLEQSRTENRHALAILFDRPPEAGAAEPAALPDGPLPRIEAGIPAGVIGRRPDVRQGELRLRRALADVDATRASFYPRLTLTGALGTGSVQLGSLLRDPTALLGVGLTLPFLQWNKAGLTIRVSRNEYEEAVVRYRQSLYLAFAEVENALSDRTRLVTRGERLEEARVAAEQAERLSGVRYRAGATALQPWLDAKERWRTAQVAVVQNRYDRLVNTMTLYKALGGPAIAAGTGS